MIFKIVLFRKNGHKSNPFCQLWSYFQGWHTRHIQNIRHIFFFDQLKILDIYKPQTVTYSILLGQNTFNGSICVALNHHSSKRFLNLAINFLKITYVSESVLWELINFLLCCSFLFTYKRWNEVTCEIPNA